MKVLDKQNLYEHYTLLNVEGNGKQWPVQQAPNASPTDTVKPMKAMIIARMEATPLTDYRPDLVNARGNIKETSPMVLKNILRCSFPAL